MRIEIYSGSRIAGLGTDLNRLQDRISETISSLQTVDRRLNELNGGLQQLATASSEIQARIRTEQDREQSVTTVKQDIGRFLESVRDTDSAVARQVSASTEKFFNQYSWLRPVVPEEKSWWDRRVEDWNNFWGAVGEGLANAWEAVKNFYIEHKKIIDTVVIVVGAVLAVAAVVGSGGVALVPLLGCVFGAEAAAVISTMVATVAVVSTIGAATLNLVDTWVEIDNPLFDKIQSRLNLISNVTNITYSVGMLFNAWAGVSAKEIATFKTEGYTAKQIRAAVRQDRLIKVYYKKIDLMTKDQKGNYGEMLADKARREEGYKRISEKTITSLDGGHTGIDGTYQRGSSYSVGEAKYNKSRLNTKILSDGSKQMTETWIENRLAQDVGKIAADEIFASFDDLDRLLIRINPGGNSPTTVNIFHLNEFAKKIGEMQTLVVTIPNISLSDFAPIFSPISNFFTQ